MSNKTILAEDIVIKKEDPVSDDSRYRDSSPSICSSQIYSSSSWTLESDLDMENSEHENSSILIKSNTEKQITCSYCGKSIKRRGITAHINRMHSNRKYICDICGVEAKTKTTIKIHLQKVHQKLRISVNCQICSITFDSYSKLSHHKRKKHPDTARLLHCTFCKYETLDSGHLYQHLKLHAGDSRKRHVCKICSRKFIHLSKMKDHMAIHNDSRDHECGVCEKFFKRASDVRKHLIYAHLEKGYECPVCMLKFGTNQNMKSHCKRNHPNFELPPPGTVLKKNSKHKYSVLLTTLRERMG